MNDLLPPITVSSRDLERIEDLLASISHKNLPGAAALRSELDRADIVEPHEVPSGLVTMNSSVLFRDETTMAEYGMTLVYPSPDNPPGAVSVLAPAGSALLGLSTGQSIAWQVPGGRKLRLKILRVTNQQSTGQQC